MSEQSYRFERQKRKREKKKHDIQRKKDIEIESLHRTVKQGTRAMYF